MIPSYQMKELHDARSAAHAFAVSLLQGSGLTTETRTKFDAAMADVERITGEIERHSRGYVTPRSNDSKREARHTEAFGRFLRGGEGALTSEHRSILEKRDGMIEGVPTTTHIGTYTGTGFLVPTGFVAMIEQATKYFAPFLDGSVYRLMETASGNPLPYPTSNDTTQQAQIVGEANPVSEQDVATNHIEFGAWKLSSGLIKCSLELMQDTGIDLEAWLAERFGERLGRGLEFYLTNGNGIGQPSGILTEIAASAVVPITATGSSETSGGSETGANSIGYRDLVSLEHSVDPSYRRNAKYMFHDTTLASLKKILDKFGRPLWVPGIAVGEPSTINGYPYVINQQVPQIAASNTTMIFGDFTKYVVRKVKDMYVQRLTERYAELGQVAFVSFARIDARLVDAGTHPLNVLQQHS